MKTNLRFKLIVLDLDYTLTDAKNRLHDEDVKAIVTAQKNGAKVFFSTGRTRSDRLQNLAKAVKLHLYKGQVFCLNGGVLYDPKSEKIDTTYHLKENHLLEIMQKIEQTKVHAVFVTEEKNVVYATKNSWLHPLIRLWARWKIEIISEEKLKSKQIVAIFLFPLWKMQAFKTFLDYAYNNGLNGYRFKNYFIQISQTNKASSLIKYLEQHKIKHDNVLIIGDSGNDLELFEKFRYTIAMGNAESMLWKLSFDQTKHYKKAGVAHALKKHLYLSTKEKN